ncbi:MAG: thiamine ABC transporter substrate-binding protein [Chloroflexota bacterium]
MTRPVPRRHALAVLVVALAAATGTAATAQSPSAVTPTGERVRLLTHGSFALPEDTLAAFTGRTGAVIEVIPAQDAGSAVNQAILTKGDPIADVLYGVDDTFLSRALEAGIFEAYQPAAAGDVPDAFQLDPERRVTPIDYGDVCVNVDSAWFAERGVAPPTTLEDLTRPEYRDLLVVEDPGVSSPGLAFVLATIARFGEDGDHTWLDYWRELRANGVQVASSWDDAYYGSFSGGSGEGDRPLVVSYASSPVAEVYYADPQPSEAPTASFVDGCYRQVEFAGVLAGTPQPELARALVDFLLSPAVQQQVPLSMFVDPVLPSVELPLVFREHTAAPVDPVTLDPATIAAGRDRWIEAWTEVVLR